MNSAAQGVGRIRTDVKTAEKQAYGDTKDSFENEYGSLREDLSFAKDAFKALVDQLKAGDQTNALALLEKWTGMVSSRGESKISKVLNEVQKKIGTGSARTYQALSNTVAKMITKKGKQLDKVHSKYVNKQGKALATYKSRSLKDLSSLQKAVKKELKDGEASVEKVR